MTFENYLLYLNGTVQLYSNKLKKNIVRLFVESGIASNEPLNQLLLDDSEQEKEQTIDISGKDLDEQILTCINSKDTKTPIRLIEKWEFTKEYKYSVVFTSQQFKDLLVNTDNLDTLELTDESDRVFEDFSSPIFLDTDDIRLIKFNLKFSALHPLTQQELLLKYPFIVAIHKKIGLIEFRFDVIKRLFLSESKEQSVYVNLVDNMIDFIKENYCCELEPVDMDFMISAAKSDSSMKLIAQDMDLFNGGRAQLYVGKNEEYVMPFIGELRALLVDFQSELEKAPILHEALEQFMYEKEEMSNYPWIEILWEDEIKTRSIHVKFIFNYMNKTYCLIQHYYNQVLVGMERMNHVIKYINDHRNTHQ